VTFGRDPGAVTDAVTDAVKDRVRPLPPLGGLNMTFLAIEVRRLLRNRRTVVVTLVMPVVLFLLFKANKRAVAIGGTEFTAATTMVGIAVYGAMLAATSGGAMVSIERALGWSRQLRLTPLRPGAYVAIKMIVAMLLGSVSVGVVYAVGAIDGVQMAPANWLLTGVLAWAASFVFAAFGLFMGYLLPSENVMQIIGPVLAVFSLFGGLFVPVSLLPEVMQTIAPYMPTYGVASIARFPLVGGAFDVTWLVSVVLWTAAFAVAATILFRRDTRRV
jgi:ABC-2 type transport system permease protein